MRKKLTTASFVATEIALLDEDGIFTFAVGADAEELEHYFIVQYTIEHDEQDIALD